MIQVAFVSRWALCFACVSACGESGTSDTGGPDGGAGGATGTMAGPGGRGGTSGNASTGAGGSPGSGGSGGSGGASVGDAGKDCATLSTEYAAAIADAKRCNPSDPMACQMMAPASLSCGCPMHVNDATRVQSLAQEWIASGCRRVICDIACINRTVGQCYAPDGGDVGACYEAPLLE